MSFNNHAQKVRNPDLTIWRRRSALRSCVVKVVWLTGERFTSIWARLNHTYGLEAADGETPDEADLLAALNALEIERSRVIEGLREFGRNRVESKIRGNRQLSKVELEHLKAIRQGRIGLSTDERENYGNRQYR